MKFKFLVLGLVLAIFSCSQADQKTIYGGIYVRFEQENQKIKAEMTFSEGKTAAEAKSIVFQNGVSFLNSAMDTRTLPGGIVRYETERTINLPENIPVHFTDPSGTKKDIALQIPLITDFKLPDAPMQLSEGFILTVDAPPFPGMEKLVLVFTDSNNKSTTLEVSGAADRKTMEFAPGQLTGLAPGKAQVYLVRTGTISTKEKGYEIEIQTEFYSATKSLVLE